MTPTERMASITTCASRVLRTADSPDGPQRVAITCVPAPMLLVQPLCPQCGEPNGAPMPVAVAGRVPHLMHVTCEPAARARIFGARVSA